MKYLYLTIDNIYSLYDDILRVSGGGSGVANRWLLESSIIFVQNDDYYSTFSEKLTHLMFSLAMNHCFVDWNKRIALAAGACFLNMNFEPWLWSKFIVEMENVILQVAAGNISKETFAKYISDFISFHEPIESTLFAVFHDLQALSVM